MAFKYDKVVRKLEGFGDLPKEKQLKLLKKILTDEEYLAWQFNPGKDHQAYTNEMIDKFYRLLAYPTPLRVFPKLLDRYNKSDFSRSSIVILNAVLTFALKNNQDMVQDLQKEYHTNGSTVESKDMKARAEKYAERLDGLKSMIHKMAKPYLEKYSRETGLSREMVYRALMVAPEPKYLPKYRITVVTMNLLEDLYSEANISGFPSRGRGVTWRPLMSELFGVENLGGVAVAILLEGVNTIDQYRKSNNLGAVRDCWDSLTNFALNELENCPENVRKQMLDLYLKKAENKLARKNGEPVNFRVNLLRLGREFSNLSRTVGVYRDAFESLFNRSRYNDRRDDYNDQRDRDRDRDRGRDRDRRNRDRRDRDYRRESDFHERHLDGSIPQQSPVNDFNETEDPTVSEDDSDDTPFNIVKPIADFASEAADKLGKGAQDISDTIARIAGED